MRCPIVTMWVMVGVMVMVSCTSTSTPTPTIQATPTHMTIPQPTNSMPTPTEVISLAPSPTPYSESSSLVITPTRPPTTNGQYQVTWYGSETDGPLYCGVDVYGWFDKDDPTTVAVGVSSPFDCGTRLSICAAVCLVVVVKDRCGACGPLTLDLSEGAWIALGRPTYVTLERRWYP